MPFSDFCQYYTDFQICYYHDSYKYSGFRYQTEKMSHNFFEFDVEVAGDYYFSLNQINKRFFPKSRSYTYSSCTLSICRKDTSGKLIYVGSIQKCDKESWFKATCQKGTYYCSIFTPWKSFVNEITWSSYGPAEVHLTALDEKNISVSMIYQEMITDKACKDLTGFKDYAAQSEPKIRYKFEHSNDGFGYFYFENNSENTTISTTISFTKAQNLKALEPHDLNNPMLTLNPGQKDIMVYFMTDSPSAVSFRLQASFKKNTKSLKKMVESEGDSSKRLYKGKDIGVNMYTLPHADGIYYQYDNNSKNYVLDETVRYHLKNCWIEGTTTDTVNVYLKPGGSKIVSIVFGAGSGLNSGQMLKCNYRISTC